MTRARGIALTVDRGWDAMLSGIRVAQLGERIAMEFASMKIRKGCPGCGTRFVRTVGWLESHAEFACSKCGLVIRTNQFMATISNVRKQIANLVRQVPAKL